MRKRTHLTEESALAADITAEEAGMEALDTVEAAASAPLAAEEEVAIVFVADEAAEEATDAEVMLIVPVSSVEYDYKRHLRRRSTAHG